MVAVSAGGIDPARIRPGHIARAAAAAAALALAGACASPAETRDSRAIDGGKAKPRSAGRTADKGAREEVATPALSAAFIRDRQQDGGEAYRLDARRRGAKAWTADNPAQGLSVEFAGDRLALRASRASGPRAAGRPARTGDAANDEATPGSDWHLELELAALGRPGALRPAPPVKRRQAEGNRVTYVRSQEIEEWYLNGPLGVEQGFDLARRPAPDRRGPLVLEVECAGLRPAGRAAQTVALEDAAKRTRLVYGALYVGDARGERVPAHMEVRGERIALAIDDAAATYPIHVDPLVWTEQQKLTASDAADSDQFGTSVALDGETAVIGAPRDQHDGMPYAGAAYVFVRQQGIWSEQQKLTASDATAYSRFGFSLALEGDTLLVGARDDGHDGVSNAGAVYVFVRASGTWSEQQKLVASDTADGAFGTSVALSADTALAGAPSGAFPASGAAYVFVRQSGMWNEQQKLVASNGASGDAFGTSVALDGDTAIVGAKYGDQPWDGGASDTGSAYVFGRQSGAWSEQQVLTASDGAVDDHFGASLALEGNTAIVGAPLEESWMTDVGAAYVFGAETGTWIEEQKLKASGGSSGDEFGIDVALAGDTALVGAHRASYVGGTRQGAVYLYVRQSGTWSEEQKVVASDGGSYDGFGITLTLDSDSALVGAPGNDHDLLSQPGAAYAFIVDTDGDGVADSNDGCPADPAKTDPGVCGCGTADTDGDSDGTADCNDGCPADPAKIAPGACGCGMPEGTCADAGPGDAGAADASAGNPDGGTGSGASDAGAGNPDGGTTGPGAADAGSGDGGLTGADSGGGCGCTAQGDDPGAPLSIFAAVALMVPVLRPRRRRRRRRGARRRR